MCQDSLFQNMQVLVGELGVGVVFRIGQAFNAINVYALAFSIEDSKI